MYCSLHLFNDEKSISYFVPEIGMIVGSTSINLFEIPGADFRKNKHVIGMDRSLKAMSMVLKVWLCLVALHCVITTNVHCFYIVTEQNC